MSLADDMFPNESPERRAYLDQLYRDTYQRTRLAFLSGVMAGAQRRGIALPASDLTEDAVPLAIAEAERIIGEHRGKAA